MNRLPKWFQSSSRSYSFGRSRMSLFFLRYCGTTQPKGKQRNYSWCQLNTMERRRKSSDQFVIMFVGKKTQVRVSSLSRLSSRLVSSHLVWSRLSNLQVGSSFLRHPSHSCPFTLMNVVRHTITEPSSLL